MRFTRSDLPGLVIATLAPVGLMFLFLESYDVWHHEGTPLLSAVSSNIALAMGVMAAFVRFVRNWDAVAVPAGGLGIAVVAVMLLQQTGNDDMAIATLMKWVGLISFLLLNVVIGFQVLTNGLLPVLDRRDARRAAAEAEQQ
jgi:hypothetical protein